MLMIDILGRFHPLLVHLPIGILVYCFMQWLYDVYRFGDKIDKYADLTFPLTLGFLSAIFSCTSGLLLAQEGGFDLDAIDYHKYMGIASALVSGLLLLLYKKRGMDRLFGCSISLLMVMIGVTGHFGGTLTHGADYLSLSAIDTEETEIMDVNKAQIFGDIVMPIVRRKCISCHNDNKSKGDLKMHTLEGWKVGGKNGAILVAGNPNISSVLHRIHLPKSDEEHMPPAGKLQLTENEIDVLEWWISNMSDYEQKVEDLEVSPKVQRYLDGLVSDTERDLPMLDMKTISDLRLDGIDISLHAPNSKWVDVSFGSLSTVSKNALKQLDQVALNVRSIDLSGKIRKDGDLKPLRNLENVQIVNLSRNPISDGAIRYLSGLAHLKNLNLYQTNITNSGLQEIAELKTLESIYLWQSEVKQEYADEIRELYPSLNVDIGADTSVFGSPQLMPPSILADADYFQDSTAISIRVDARNSVISYRIGSSGELKVYDSPFTIFESTIVSAYTSLSGWKDSAASSRTFVKAGHNIADITLSQPPNEAYAGEGAATLYDLKKGSEDFLDGKWLGYHESGVTAVVDLGSQMPVSTISVGNLINHESHIFSPIAIRVFVSDDAKAYTAFVHLDIPLPTETVPAGVINHRLSGAATTARYLKVDIKSPKYNPTWHPAPGAPCWIFVDEIIVE